MSQLFLFVDLYDFVLTPCAIFLLLISILTTHQSNIVYFSLPDLFYDFYACLDQLTFRCQLIFFLLLLQLLMTAEHWPDIKEDSIQYKSQFCEFKYKNEIMITLCLFCRLQYRQAKNFRLIWLVYCYLLPVCCVQRFFQGLIGKEPEPKRFLCHQIAFGMCRRHEQVSQLCKTQFKDYLFCRCFQNELLWPFQFPTCMFYNYCLINSANQEYQQAAYFFYLTAFLFDFFIILNNLPLQNPTFVNAYKRPLYLCAGTVQKLSKKGFRWQQDIRMSQNNDNLRKIAISVIYYFEYKINFN